MAERDIPPKKDSWVEIASVASINRPIIITQPKDPGRGIPTPFRKKSSSLWKFRGFDRDDKIPSFILISSKSDGVGSGSLVDYRLVTNEENPGALSISTHTDLGSPFTRLHDSRCFACGTDSLHFRIGKLGLGSGRREITPAAGAGREMGV